MRQRESEGHACRAEEKLLEFSLNNQGNVLGREGTELNRDTQVLSFEGNGGFSELT